MLTPVVHFPALLWLAMAAIGAAAVIAFLHYLAVSLENESRMERLRAQAAELRRRYRRQLQEAGGTVPDDEVIEVSPADPATEPLRRAA